MRTSTLLSLSAGLLLSFTSQAAVAPIEESAYVTRDQYSAVLHQSRGVWQLQPANGQDLMIDTLACQNGKVLPKGLWLLVPGERGRYDLVAPSVTRLPAGAAPQVKLRDCAQAGPADLAVPQALIDLLAQQTSAVYVNE
ncbi:hypothetical protein [Arenimonas sp.]|uniref:hypothetical protein n=1 Tax=Arenimonas sp. TaxID=1872635 RepID=UPI0039E5F00D